MDRWRRWIPGAGHGPARSVGVFGRPGRSDPALLAEMLGKCEQLRTWARTYAGFELENIPDDLPLLDSAFDQAIDLAGRELAGPSQIGLLANQAGLYLGTVIAGTVPGARWRLWPNGHRSCGCPRAATSTWWPSPTSGSAWAHRCWPMPMPMRLPARFADQTRPRTVVLRGTHECEP